MGESAAASARTETASELPFEKPQTAREKAAAIERSKRDAEMAELRRLRAENNNTAAGGDGLGSGVGGAGAMKFGQQQISVQTTSSDAARRKREEEMEEIRRLKAGENEENRKRLSQLGGPLTTDMDAWRKNQWGAQAADRKNKLEAQSNLKSHKSGGFYETKTEAALDKAAYTQAQKERMAGMKELSLEDEQEDPHSRHPEGGVMEGGKWLEEEEDGGVKGNVMFKDGADEQIPIPKVNGGLRVSFSSKTVAQILPREEDEGDERDANNERSVMFKDADEQIPIQEEKRKTRVSFSNNATSLISPEVAPPEEEEDARPKVQFAPSPVAAAPEPELKTPPENIPETLPAEESARESTLVAVPNEPAPTPTPTPPPAYSRVDIKFSFGLIVRSSAVDGFETENLRDNETLRKCMEGTSKILHVQLPSPPDASSASAETTDFSDFPEAYYDPTLEPTIISIEEDQRKESSDGKKKTTTTTTTTAKGNKRTLVKASFPVFLRDEETNEEGKKRNSRMLKETKTTVFKALRAAVSGGSFLR